MVRWLLSKLMHTNLYILIRISQMITMTKWMDFFD